MIHLYLTETHVQELLDNLDHVQDTDLKFKLERALGNVQIYSDDQWSWIGNPKYFYFPIRMFVKVKEDMQSLKIQDLMTMYGDPTNAVINNRIAKALKRCECETVSDFLNLKVIQFRNIRNLGVSAQAAFFEALKEIVI
ncbi:hypothetical protein ACTHPF_15535 [Paenibacillus sp. SAF-054]|uniref:hypothetical protein n=1 Tax=unclassified Paenibacillus TaxID=185978 RepID=UPI003F7F631F